MLSRSPTALSENNDTYNPEGLTPGKDRRIRMDYGQEIGKIIGELRRARGMTQEQLAAKLGITYQAVSKWENGQACPDIALLPLLAQTFGVTVDSLFGLEPEDREPADEWEEECLSEGGVQCDNLPWEDDGTLRAVLFIGRRLVAGPAEELRRRNTKVRFVYEGGALNVESCFSVECGDVQGSVRAGGDVNCGDVQGAVHAGDGVHCSDVSDSVKAGNSVKCGDVAGSVAVGTTVSCSDVGDNVECGSISCGDIGGFVNSQGDVTCGDVGGDVQAQNVHCGDVSGDVKTDGEVRCSDVGGSVTAQIVASCGDVGGSVECATISCGDVYGGVKINRIDGR